MKKSSEFHDYVLYDVLGHIDGITSRSMFGGYGLYLNGVIFGIIAEGTLYFKVDDSNRSEFEKRGSVPFSYKAKGGKNVSMNYYEVPEEIMSDRDAIREWIDVSAHIRKSKKN